jgi:tRNA(His) guanylyltransferase
MDKLGDRMKMYEGIATERKLIPLLPIMVRLDGRSFSKFTKGMKKPYDETMVKMMGETTKFLIEETNANLGYTQSDEISLVIFSDSTKSQTFFNGKIFKLVSTLAALTSVKFYEQVSIYMPEKAKMFPTFDCRVWNVPNLDEAANTILWRENDATKNSIFSAAHCHFSRSELHGKNRNQMQELLFQKGINWNDYPDFFKRGQYFCKDVEYRKFTQNEMESLPKKHEARKNPDLKIKRNVIKQLNFGKLSSMENRVEVLFMGYKPIYKTEGES